MIEHPKTMEEVYRNQEELATTRSDEWMAAYVANTRKIVGHPRFSQLVREVAVAEQPSMLGLFWLRRNSFTYGTWATRGMPQFRQGSLRRRADKLSEDIAHDLGWSHRDDIAKVYVAARDYVRCRQMPRREER